LIVPARVVVVVVVFFFFEIIDMRKHVSICILFCWAMLPFSHFLGSTAVNNIGDDGAVALEKVLKSINSLVFLDLTGINSYCMSE